MGETGLFSNFMFFFRPLLTEASLPTRKGALQLGEVAQSLGGGRWRGEAQADRDAMKQGPRQNVSRLGLEKCYVLGPGVGQYFPEPNTEV